MFMNTHGKVVLSCVLAACLSSTAMANPVTMKDLVGKKICWFTPNPPPGGLNSTTATYSLGGKYYNTGWGVGTITATANGFHYDTERGSFDARLEKLPNGTFKSTLNFNGTIIESTGHYCK
jgi:hypothetical protein